MDADDAQLVLKVLQSRPLLVERQVHVPLGGGVAAPRDRLMFRSTIHEHGGQHHPHVGLPRLGALLGAVADARVPADVHRRVAAGERLLDLRLVLGAVECCATAVLARLGHLLGVALAEDDAIGAAKPRRTARCRPLRLPLRQRAERLAERAGCDGEGARIRNRPGERALRRRQGRPVRITPD